MHECVITYCYLLIYSFLMIFIVRICTSLYSLILWQLLFFLQERIYAYNERIFWNKTVIGESTFVVTSLIFSTTFLQIKHQNKWCSTSLLFLFIEQLNDHGKDAIFLSSFLLWAWIHFIYLLHFSRIPRLIRFVISIDDSYFTASDILLSIVF